MQCLFHFMSQKPIILKTLTSFAQKFLLNLAEIYCWTVWSSINFHISYLSHCVKSIEILRWEFDFRSTWKDDLWPPTYRLEIQTYWYQCSRYTCCFVYFGRTIQKAHDRTNTHRKCFSEDKWEDSALSMHIRSKQEEVFDLQNFKITLVKKCSPKTIRREEFKAIDKYRAKIRGINRYIN